MIDYFRRTAPALLQHGYRPIPILPGTKKPMTNDWPHFELRLADVERFALGSVGVLCGHGLVVADADVYDPDLARWTKTMLLSKLGMAPHRVGRLPKFALPYRLDAARATGKVASRGWRNPGDPARHVNRLEFLGRGNYIVTHGVHPDTGAEYRWPVEDLARLPIEALSEIDTDDITRVCQAFDTQCILLGFEPCQALGAIAQSHRPSKQGQRAVDADKVLAAVAMIPNDALPYEDWIEVGLALKGALGDTAEGVEAWLNFSEQYEGNDIDTCLAKWDSFHPKAIGAGTIMHLAREAQRKKGLDFFAPVDEPTPSHGVPVPEQAQAYLGPTHFAPAGRLAEALGRIGWLIPGVLHLGHVYTLTAKPSHGKTSVGALLAACVQGGTPFAGVPTKQGQVLYCAADDPYGVIDRLELLALEGLTAAADVLVSMHAFDVTALEVQEQLVQIAEEQGDIAVIALDTLLYNTPGSIDSDNDKLGLAPWLAVARELTKLPGHPCVIVFCHPPKGATNDPEELVPRGGSAVLAASDGNLTLWNDEGIATLHHSAKLRGGFDAISFRIERGVQIGSQVDDDGYPVRTVRITALDAPAVAQLQALQASSEQRVMEWLRSRERDEWVGSGAIELGLGLSQRQVQRVLQVLLEAKLVRSRGVSRSTSYQAVARR